MKNLHFLVFLALTLTLPELSYSKPKRIRKQEKTNPLIDTEISFKLKKPATEEALSGFTLYPVAVKGGIKLINMSGKVVKSWPYYAHRARLLPNCNLLVLHATSLSEKKENKAKEYLKIREYNWEGKVVWEYSPPTDPHHDLQRLENGNTLILRKKIRTYSVKEDNIPRKLRSDIVEEITPDLKVVWSWDADKHLNFLKCGARKCNQSPAHEKWKETNRDWSHTNTVFKLKDNKWFRNKDLRFQPGNIMVMLRNLWTTYILDKDTGKVVWQYSGTKDNPIIAPHESQMIPDGYPGAGNILIYDNGGKVRKYTRILEVNPVTKEIVWEYKDKDNFFSGAAGSMRRLPNGNTFISEDNGFSVFEVNKKGEIVWQVDSSHPLNRGQRYEIDYCSQLKNNLVN